MRTYAMRSGARRVYYGVGAIVCLLVFPLPLGLWILYRARHARVELRPDGLVEYGITTVRMPFAQMRRLGLLEVPIALSGVGAALAREKCGGDVGINLCALDARGKTRKFMASMYEDYRDLIDETVATRKLPLETLTLGALSVKWPEPPGARA